MGYMHGPFHFLHTYGEVLFWTVLDRSIAIMISPYRLYYGFANKNDKSLFLLYDETYRLNM